MSEAENDDDDESDGWKKKIKRLPLKGVVISYLKLTSREIHRDSLDEKIEEIFLRLLGEQGNQKGNFFKSISEQSSRIFKDTSNTAISEKKSFDEDLEKSLELKTLLDAIQKDIPKITVSEAGSRGEETEQQLSASQ